MEFLVLAGLGVLTLLLLKPQTSGALTGQSTPIKTTVAQGKDVLPTVFQAPQLLAMGHATFGTDRSPATIGFSPEVVGTGSQFPAPQQSLGITGFNLTSMLDGIRSLFDSGLSGQPGTSASGGQPHTGAVNSPVGVGPQAGAVVYPPPSNSPSLQSGKVPVPNAYAAPNTPQTAIAGNDSNTGVIPTAQVIPPNSVGSPTTSVVPPRLMTVPSGPNIPVGSSQPPAPGLATPPPNLPFQVAVSSPATQPLFSGGLSDQSAYPTSIP